MVGQNQVRLDASIPLKCTAQNLAIRQACKKAEILFLLREESLPPGLLTEFWHRSTLWGT